jgi:hypothetical protein
MKGVAMRNPRCDKGWISRSFTILTALILMASAYSSVPAFGQQGAVVEVNTVEELYAEFYNPNNVGATIQLMPKKPMC